jgi:chemotaxis protein CheC
VEERAFSEIQLDALREIGNVGAGNAATALSDLLQQRVDIGVPEIQLVDTTQIRELIGGAEREVVGIHFSLTGEFEGAAMYVFPVEEAFRLSDHLLGRQPGETNELGEMEVSVTCEVANILTGSYITALQGFTQVTCDMSPPSAICSTALVVLGEMSVVASMAADKTIWMQTDFHLGDGGEFAAFLILLATPESMVRVLRSLGVG